MLFLIFLFVTAGDRFYACGGNINGRTNNGRTNFDCCGNDGDRGICHGYNGTAGN